MTIKSEISLENFKAWSGGENTLNRIIREEKCDTLEVMLEDLYPDGMTDTELNDLLWHDSDTVFEWLGIRTYDQIKEELEEKKAELEDLQSGYEFDCKFIREHAEDYGMNENLINLEMERLYESDYEDNIEELKERISELEEELSAA